MNAKISKRSNEVLVVNFAQFKSLALVEPKPEPMACQEFVLNYLFDRKGR
jgi:hypothetical protein